MSSSALDVDVAPIFVCLFSLPTERQYFAEVSIVLSRANLHFFGKQRGPLRPLCSPLAVLAWPENTSNRNPPSKVCPAVCDDFGTLDEITDCQENATQTVTARLAGPLYRQSTSTDPTQDEEATSTKAFSWRQR